MSTNHFPPVPFTFGGAKYQVCLGLKEVAQIESLCAASVLSVVGLMEAGFLSAVIHVSSVTLRRESEVGFIPVDYAEIGPIVNDPEKGYTKAFAEAFEQLGNVLGLAGPSKKASKSGSKSA